MSDKSPDVFEKFIEEVLNMDDLPTLEDIVRQLIQPRGLDPAEYPQLRRDIREIWNDLMREGPGSDYWLHHLAPIEQETRGILVGMILKSVRRKFGSTPSDAEMEAIITYSITLGWMVVGALYGKYFDEQDDEADGQGFDLFF